MLGWLIIVRKAVPAEPEGIDSPSVLATWESSTGGLDWLEALADEGKAELRSGNGYPTRYVLRAKDILPFLSQGQAPKHVGFAVIGDDYLMPAGWTGCANFHGDRIATCAAEEELIVEAWDQS